jgi:DNA-binding NarL/FixJ family response regulator
MARTILLVDDHVGFRQSARALLDAEGFHVVGEADSGADALAKVAALHPELVLLDIQLPDHDGFEVAAQMASEDSRLGIILISSRGAREYGGRVEQAPVLGFIDKARLSGATVRELVG